MIGTRVGINLNFGPSRESVCDLLACFGRYKLVQFRKVHHHRTGDLVFEAEIFFYTDPVVADRSVDITMGSGADFSLARVVRLQG